MIEKLKVNMARQWPEPKDGEPRLHITAPPAPAVPTFEEWLSTQENKPLGWVRDSMKESYDACRAAMLAQPVSQGGKLVPVEPTEAMLLVLGLTGSFESMNEKWQKMLAAAPDRN